MPGTLAASVTPRKDVDEVLIAIAVTKKPRKTISMPPPTVEADKNLRVISFDARATVKKKGGSYSAIIWKNLELTMVAAISKLANL